MVTLLTAIGYCWFWWCFITKVWSFHHIIIAMFINGVCYRGSSEMSQIWVQWSHFLTVIGYCVFWWCFITKVSSVHHIIIVLFINVVCYRRSSNIPQIWVQWSHFLTAIGYCWFWWCFQHKRMFSWSYNHCCIYQWCGLYGVFRNVPNSRAVVTLFGGDWLLLILMMFSTQTYVQLII